MLGYLSTLDRTPEVEERIQMHADALWQRMQAQEDAIAQAKREGKPVPEFASILLPSTTKPTSPSTQSPPPPQGAADTAASGGSSASASSDAIFASPQFQAELEARLKQLDAGSGGNVAAMARQAEEAAVRAEWRARAEATDGVRRFREARDERDRLEREQRLARGENANGGWWGEIVKGVWGR